MPRAKLQSIPSTASLVTEAASRGIAPAFQLVSSNRVERGWLVVARVPDSVYADEFGDLWWAKASGPRCARVVRALWPEEASSLSHDIDRGVSAILAR